MLKPAVAFFVILLFAGSAHAECKGIWEVDTLASTNSPHLLLSDKKHSYRVSAEFLQQLKAVRARIDRQSGIYTRLIICNADDANAFAFKDGQQNMTAVTLGLIRLLGDDMDAYAALLGHENAHLVGDHGSQRAQANTGMSIIQLLAGIALEVAIQGAGGTGGLGSDIASMGKQAFSASYSRTHEYEADRLGLQYSIGAGFAPAGALRLHRALNASSSFMSTHPSSEDRALALRKLMDEMGVTSAHSALRREPEIPVNEGPVIKGQASFAVVVSAKPRHGYFIATQVGLEPPRESDRVAIRYENGERLEGKIRKTVNGYFSVITEKPFTASIEGASIERLD